MEEASQALMAAVKFDSNKEYEKALVSYKKGINLLLHVIKDKDDSEKEILTSRVEKYLERAEEIRNILYKCHEQIVIHENATGHGYRAVFGKYLNDQVTRVEIKDAYIREHFQIENLVKFLEVLKSGCKNLLEVELVTGKQSEKQVEAFEQLKSSLHSYGVSFIYDFSGTLHDREIKFDNGWVFKIGRGLNYFKKCDSKYSLGVFDLNLRKCLETTIDIFHVDKVTLQK